jgi:hypothetical protein
MFSKKSEINQSNVRKCVVSFGINSLSPKDCPPKIWQDFPRGVRRIRERLKELYFKGDFIGWDKDYPPGTPPFKEVGDRLKPFCFLDAWRNGYDLVLFVDSSVYFNVSPEPLFKLIEKRGYFFVATGYSIGSYCSDAALKALGISRKESFSIKCCMSTIMGLDLRNENSRIFLQEYIKQATEGTAFEGAKWSGVRGYPVTVSTDPRVVGHRRQVVPSVIAYKLGMKRLMRRKDVYKYIIIDRKYVRSYDEDCGKIENASV